MPVCEAVAAAIADEVQLSKQVDKANEEVKLWLGRAHSTILRDDEASAEVALDQKRGCDEQSLEARNREIDSERSIEQSLKFRRRIGECGAAVGNWGGDGQRDRS